MRDLVQPDTAFYINCRPGGRSTVLHQAAAQGNAAVVRFLIAKGADRSVQNEHGKTAAAIAADCANADEMAAAFSGNPTSYDIYVEAGKQMVGERTFWHGTSLSSARRIEQDGFRPSNYGEMGPGVYVVDEENIDKACIKTIKQ